MMKVRINKPCSTLNFNIAHVTFIQQKFNFRFGNICYNYMEYYYTSSLTFQHLLNNHKHNHKETELLSSFISNIGLDEIQ